MIEKIRNLTMLERIAEAGKRGELAEWSAEGIFKQLQLKSLTQDADQ